MSRWLRARSNVAQVPGFGLLTGSNLERSFDKNTFAGSGTRSIKPAESAHNPLPEAHC